MAFPSGYHDAELLRGHDEQGPEDDCDDRDRCERCGDLIDGPTVVLSLGEHDRGNPMHTKCVIAELEEAEADPTWFGEAYWEQFDERSVA